VDVALLYSRLKMVKNRLKNHFPIEQNAEVENRSVISTTNRVRGPGIKKKKNK